jgi:hypothetical protein
MEGGPSFRLKVGTNQFECSVAEVGLFGLGIWIIRERVGILVDETESGGPTFGQRTIGCAAKVVRNATLSDHTQPTSKRVLWTVITELRQLLGDRQKDVLHNIVGIVAGE